MLSHDFIALGSLRQQKATETKKSVLIGSHRAPPPASIVGSTGTGMLYPVNRVSAATQILDRAYGRPVQSIDANINDDPVRYIVELPEKSATTEEWLESIRREDAARSLVTGVAAAVDQEQTHSAESESALSRG